MSRCVPSWDLEDINPNHDLFKLDYEVGELKWQNGQLAMQEVDKRRVPTKSQPTTSWDNPRATDTLEAIVNHATHKPCYKPPVMVNDNKLVPWLNSHKPTITVGNLNASATITADALVPSSNNRIIDTGCSTRIGSCSGTFGIGDTYDGNQYGQRVTSTSMGSPENTSSGRDGSMSTFVDDSVCHCSTQDGDAIKEKKKGKEKSSILNTRTTARHNQSEWKRRDKINQRMKTLQKLVPNSSKTDKASMLDEVIEYVNQLQAQVHMMNSMNMSPLMMPLVMQQQQQMQQMSMMNSMGMGLGLSSIPSGFHPSIFMPIPSWNSHPVDPISAFLPSHTQPVNMDSYNRMAALYQHMQNQSCGPLPKK